MKETIIKIKYDTPVVEVLYVRVEAGMNISGANNPEDPSNASTSQLENARWN